MKIGVGSDDIVAVIYGLPSEDVPDLLKLQEGVYNNGNSGCLIGPTFAKDHNLKVGSRISIGTNGDKGTLRVTGIIEERGMSFDISTDSALVVTKEWFENTYDRNADYDEVVVKVKDGDTASVKTAIENQLNKRKDQKIVIGDGQQGDTGNHLFDIWNGNDIRYGNWRYLDGCRGGLDLQRHDDVRD